MFMIMFAGTILTDTFAYFIGKLLGKNNKGIVKVSPNKSVAGFIAALVFPAIIGCLCGVFIKAFEVDGYLGFFLGLSTAAAAAINNLVESVPSNIVAKTFGFEKQELFKANEDEKQNIKVSL